VTATDIGTATAEVEGVMSFLRARTLSWIATSSARMFVFSVRVTDLGVK